MLTFKLKPIKQAKPFHLNNIRSKSFTVLEKDADGVVIEDSSTGELKVSSKGQIYTIHPDSYKTRGKRRVYKKDDTSRWYEWDRPCFDDRSENGNYVPFMPKLMVKGNIISKDNIQYFKVKVCWNKNNIDAYNEAMNLLKQIDDNESNES